MEMIRHYQDGIEEIRLFREGNAFSEVVEYYVIQTAESEVIDRQKFLMLTEAMEYYLWRIVQWEATQFGSKEIPVQDLIDMISAINTRMKRGL